jgi:hypothetical protein
MMDEIIRKWKDVSPEDITSKPDWEKGWSVEHSYVVKVHDENDIPMRVLKKAGFNKWHPHQEEIIQKLLESDKNFLIRCSVHRHVAVSFI